MKAHELKRAKRDVRRAVLALRDAMSAEERARRGALAVARFLALAEVRAASTVLAFWSFGSEIPTQDLLRALDDMGTSVALPHIVEGDLELRSYRPGEELALTAFGVMEPARGRTIEVGELDLVCTPAVAFDRAGWRIGYGGGYFDRLFTRTSPETRRIGLGFSIQVLDAVLPHGAFDARLHALVTEDEVMRWE